MYFGGQGAAQILLRLYRTLGAESCFAASPTPGTVRAEGGRRWGNRCELPEDPLPRLPEGLSSVLFSDLTCLLNRSKARWHSLAHVKEKKNQHLELLRGT